MHVSLDLDNDLLTVMFGLYKKMVCVVRVGRDIPEEIQGKQRDAI